ncbi:MAG: hypothetical protein IKL10_04265 [Clostridia bacterium]|nr:hypothetical protein [Clostridia bacterium]
MNKLYDLIPSQDTMYLMQKYTFHKQIIQIPTSFMVDMDVDFNTLTKALNIEIERNDSMRLRFKKDKKKIQQYFLDSYKIDSVKVLSFKTEDEQNKFFTKDAQTPVRFLKDECYRIYFFNSYNGYKGIYLNASHMAMDAMGILVFYLDLLAIYKALKMGEEMPAPLLKYEDYIIKEHERCSDKERFEKDKKFYHEYFLSAGEPTYSGVHGPEFLQKERKKKKNPELKVPSAYSPLLDKAEVINKKVSPELSMKILEFCKSRSVAPESLLLLGMRTHLSWLNGRDPYGMQLLMCSKRIKHKDFRTGGCMAQPLQVRTVINEDMTFTQALDEFLAVRTSLYRHLTYPYTVARDQFREMYNYSLIQGPASLMFSWLPIPVTEFKDFKFDFKTYNLGRYFSPLYAICYPDPQSASIALHYMYRVKLINPGHLDALHNNTLKIIEQGIENPEITIGELLDSLN